MTDQRRQAVAAGVGMGAAGAAGLILWWLDVNLGVSIALAALFGTLVSEYAHFELELRQRKR